MAFEEPEHGLSNVLERICTISGEASSAVSGGEEAFKQFLFPA